MIIQRVKSERYCLGLILACLLYWTRQLTSASSAARNTPRFGQTLANRLANFDLVSQGTSSNREHIFPVDFPKHIWQTSKEEFKAKWGAAITSWKELNPDWTHHYLSDDAATAFVHEHFAHRNSIIYFWDSLSDPILRADLFRYLVLLARGGVYSDIDTSALAPIASWIPPDLLPQTNAVVGIEYDDKPGTWAIRSVSLCQWTLMAKPGHPLYERLVERLMGNLEFAARLQHTDLGHIDLQVDEVLAATGSGLMSDVVLEVIRDQVDDLRFDWENLHGLKKPTLFGDVLVLPVNGFAGNQKHSHSGEEEYGEKLVQHHFRRSWYVKDQGKARKNQGMKKK